jgi:hypothetical protein
MAKGPIDTAINFLVSPGDTFRIYVDKNRWKEMTRAGEPSDHLLPSDGEVTVIPAFSLLEVTIATKNSDAATDKGSCVNIMKIRPLSSDVSVHSVAGALKKLPSSLNEALSTASNKSIAVPWIAQDLVKDAVSFYRQTCSTETSCEIVEIVDKSGVSKNAVRLCGWSDERSENINNIDVMEETFLAATNATRLDHAIALMQVAFSMGAVSLFITHDSFLAKNNASALRALPIISASKMFKKMKFNPEKTKIKDHVKKIVEIDSGAVYCDGEGSGVQPILFTLCVEPTIVDDQNDLKVRPSIDFPFMMGYNSSKFLTVTASFGAEPPKPAVQGVLVFNVDISKKSASSVLGRSNGPGGAGGLVKRKLTQMSFT